MIHVASLESWYHDRWKGPIYFLQVSRYFAHDIQYIAARLKVELRQTKYLHQDSCIPSTEDTCLLVIHVASLLSWYQDKWKGPIYFLQTFQIFCP
jgi:hypothetical protein